MPKWIRKATTEQAPVQTPTNENLVTIEKSVLDTLLDNVKALQLAEKKRNEKETPNLAKEKYVWPRQYRYKLYSEVVNDAVVNTPILSYRGIKGNPTEDLVHGNVNGGYDINHYVILTLQGRTETVKVPITTFMRCERSKPTFPKYVIDSDGERVKGDTKLSGREWFANEIIGYVFENELGEFTVSPNCIN